MRCSLLLALWALAAFGQHRGAPERCRDACLRLVRDERQRANVCGRCLTDTERGAWVLRLAEYQPGMDELGPILLDPDWEVRWGAVRAWAKVRGFDEQRQLATWVVEGKSKLPCLTVAHLSGAKNKEPAELFKDAGPMGPSALGLCQHQKDELKKALEVELYSGDPLVQREALAHLAAFLKTSPARVVLDAMATRPDDTDAIPAQLLLDDAEARLSAAGAGLLAAAKPEDKARVDRLLAVFSRELDAWRPKLRAQSPEDRREAVAKLTLLGPLGSKELEGALEDPDPKVARAAAKGLARGEGRTLSAYALARLDPQLRLPLEKRLKWVALAGQSNDEGCAALLGQLADDARQPEAIRSAAVAAVGPCAGAKAMPQLARWHAAPELWAREGALEALAAVPRSSEASKWASDALDDPEPRVQVAALHSVGPLVLSNRAARVAALLAQSPSEAVRAAAARALGELGGPSSSPGLSLALKKDAAPSVRQAAAEALGRLGGNEALVALRTAAESDPNPQVKLVASASLRKLGVQPGP